MRQSIALCVSLLVSLACGCADGGARDDALRISAFSVVREAYDQAVLPAFARAWRARTGRTPRFEVSYGASGAQSRAVVGGFDADVVAFSMQADVDRLAAAGLVTHDTHAAPHDGMVTRSIVALAVRAGNPRRVTGWSDLSRPDVSVLTANPRTSGGATWNVAAILGAARRARTGRSDEQVLQGVLARVDILDRSGRDSVQTFERGMGDVVVTYENEIVVGRRSGQTYEQVTPRSTLRIDNPAALVDAYADAHGRRPIAEAFLAFLRSPEAQRAFADWGLRPVDPGVARETEGRFAPVDDLFTIADLGGFGALQREVFAPGAVWDRAFAAARRPR